MINQTSSIYHQPRGTWQHCLTSACLAGESLIEVRLPDNYAPTRRYPVVYLLPCEAGDGCQFGDPQLEVLQVSPKLRAQCIFVRPTFATLPWYAHHATDPQIRHDLYFRTEVIPLVEQLYSTTGAAGRLLLGFSKSGWGAFSLIARYPQFFTAAASWDAPLLLEKSYFGVYGTAGHFGTSAHFSRFCPSALVRTDPIPFQQRPRLVLAGQQAFGPESLPSGCGECHTAAMHDLLTELAIPHHFHNDLNYPHRWHAGWMEPLLEDLLSMLSGGTDV